MCSDFEVSLVLHNQKI